MSTDQRLRAAHPVPEAGPYRASRPERAAAALEHLAAGPAPPVQIRAATDADTDRIADVLDASLAWHPLCCWLFATDPTDPWRLMHQPWRRALIRAVTAWAIGHGTVHVAGQDGIEAAAVWLPTGGTQELAELMRVAAGPAADRLAHFVAVTEHPEQPGSHLRLLGVLPETQHHRHGTELLLYRLGQLDVAEQTAYLESLTRPAADLFRAVGFRFTGTSTQLPAGPMLWPMSRPPGAVMNVSARYRG